MSSGDEELSIEAKDLRKVYGNETAVDNVSLGIGLGTIYGFLGPNGAGKTTTMRMLTGLTRMSSGEARVMGVDVGDRRNLIQHIGYLPEEPPLYEEFTGREQLEYVADLRDIPRETAQQKIGEYLETFDLVGDEDKRISDYSKGMLQKTAFIQAVLHDPDVIFLDEPTAGLDPRAARTMRENILDLSDDGTTIFLSTHILPVVEEVADEVGVLFEGRLVAEGSPEELKEQAESETGSLEDAFLAVTQHEEQAQ